MAVVVGLPAAERICSPFPCQVPCICIVFFPVRSLREQKETCFLPLVMQSVSLVIDHVLEQVTQKLGGFGDA